MISMRTVRWGLLAGFGLTWATAARAGDVPGPVTLDLWPGTVPGETGKIEPEKVKQKTTSDPITEVTNVNKPTLTVFRPEPGTSNGAAVVICPGGGYNVLAWDHEGLQVAKWLNANGVTGVLLKYRVPRRPGTAKGEPPIQALMDAQRALSLTRSKAGDWGLDPKRIGILGFSAGGHLAAWASTNSDKAAYEPVDDADKASRRPDFAVLVYPGGVVKRGTSELTPEIRVSSESPPMFLAHAGNDPVPVEGSIAIYQALKRNGVPAELHVYSTGGHGFGMRATGNPSAGWPQRCEEWLRVEKVIKPATR